MKFYSYNNIYIVLYSLLLIVFIKTANNLKLTAPAKTKSNQIQTTISSGYFFLQKFFPGKEPELVLKESEKESKRKYFKLTQQMLYYSESQTNADILDDEFDVSDIYDKNNDDASKGKCCNNIRYNEFPLPGNNVASDSSPEIADSMPGLARYCIDIDVFNAIHWRICHRVKNTILKFKTLLSYEVIKFYMPNIQANTMEKLLLNSESNPLHAPAHWSWFDEKSWKGYCNTKIMQSPIDVVAGQTTKSDKTKGLSFKVNYSFSDKIEFVVKDHGEEVIIDFIDPEKNGYVELDIGTPSIPRRTRFHPSGLFFRFRAEHPINKKRFDGELVFVFEEQTKDNDKKLKITESLHWTIPLFYTKEIKDLIPELDAFMPHLWRFELAFKSSFAPKHKNKPKTFNLSKFFNHVERLKSDYSIYLGSETTPPCRERVLYIVNLKPLPLQNCQFKVFQDNSLKSSRSTEIHARSLQSNNIKTEFSYVGPPDKRKVKKSGKKEKDRDENEPNCDLTRPSSAPDSI